MQLIFGTDLATNITAIHTGELASSIKSLSVRAQIAPNISITVVKSSSWMASGRRPERILAATSSSSLSSAKGAFPAKVSKRTVPKAKTSSEGSVPTR